MAASMNDASKMSESVATVLIVDDDPTIRGLERIILRSQGYKVLEAESAAEAMRLAPESVLVDLLITDFLMAEVDGLELARRFREVHPKTPILMVSGSMASLPDRGENLESLELLPKPFGLNALLRKVHELLDMGGSPPHPSGSSFAAPAR